MTCLCHFWNQTHFWKNLFVLISYLITLHFLLQFLKVEKIRNIFLVKHISQKINEKNARIFHPVIFIILQIRTIFFINISVEMIQWLFWIFPTFNSLRLLIYSDSFSHYFCRLQTKINIFENIFYRNWMNSLGVSPYVNCLSSDLADGLIIFQLYEIISPGCVEWNKVTRKFSRMKKFMEKIQNCNYVVELGRRQKYSLVGIAGKFLLIFLKKSLVFFIKINKS